MARLFAILLCTVSLLAGYAPAGAMVAPASFATTDKKDWVAPQSAGAVRTLALALYGQIAERFGEQGRGVAVRATYHRDSGQSRVETSNELQMALGAVVALIFAVYFFVQRQRNIDEAYQEE